MTEATKKLSARDVQTTFDRSPFIGWLGLKVVSLDHDRREIDIAGDFAIGMLVGGGVPTMNFRTDYLRPAIGEAITAKARVRRAGKTTAIVDIEVIDDQEKLVALGRGAYSSTAG
jgi:acyl-coenzyme A thioesterase PaaI-like protein